MEKIPLTKISKTALETKVFNRTESQIRERFQGDELEAELAKQPTEEEADWMRIWNLSDSRSERVRRKMSICVFVEVDEISETGFSYTYADKKIEVIAPQNSLKCSEARDRGRHAGVQAMCEQSCIKANGVLLNLTKNTMEVDEIQMLAILIDRFFFQISLG